MIKELPEYKRKRLLSQVCTSHNLIHRPHIKESEIGAMYFYDEYGDLYYDYKDPCYPLVKNMYGMFTKEFLKDQGIEV